MNSSPPPPKSSWVFSSPTALNFAIRNCKGQPGPLPPGGWDPHGNLAKIWELFHTFGSPVYAPNTTILLLGTTK